MNLESRGLFAGVKWTMMFVAAVAWVYTPAANATDFCVSSPSELANAFGQAANNAQADEIRISVGVYTISTAGLVVTDGFGVDLLGGFDSNCNFRDVNNSVTELSPSVPGGVILRLATGAAVSKLEDISFNNGYVEITAESNVIVKAITLSSSVPIEVEQDSDGDGVFDSADACPQDPNGTTDTDGDAVCDYLDVFPRDPSETQDSDRDGVGDNADAFPRDPFETVDTDGDGVGDNEDEFPNDPARTGVSSNVGLPISIIIQAICNRTPERCPK